MQDFGVKRRFSVMGIIAAICGTIGGLLAVVGIITATEVITVLMPQLTWMFWFVLSAILLLAAIALALGRSGGNE